jgi:O-acetyl-ADP-ribose deacetylase (regulator of RNase III)
LTSQGVKGIIHTPGPDCHISEQNENRQQLLVSCYKNSITLAKEKGWRSIAFPPISTAIFKYPIEEASEIAINAVNEELTNSGDQIENVYFVCYDDRTYNRYIELLSCPQII